MGQMELMKIILPKDLEEQRKFKEEIEASKKCSKIRNTAIGYS